MSPFFSVSYHAFLLKIVMIALRRHGLVKLKFLNFLELLVCHKCRHESNNVHYNLQLTLAS